MQRGNHISPSQSRTFSTSTMKPPGAASKPTAPTGRVGKQLRPKHIKTFLHTSLLTKTLYAQLLRKSCRNQKQKSMSWSCWRSVLSMRMI